MALVYLNPVQQQIDNANRQLALLHAQRQNLFHNLAMLDRQIAEWTAYIEAIRPVAQQMDNPQLQGTSLADLCRFALDAHGDWVSAQQVRTYITQLGVKLEYNNVMAVLHNTLKRIGQAGRDSFGNTVYAKKGF